jgi:hypothetical protein
MEGRVVKVEESLDWPGPWPADDGERGLELELRG